MTDSWGKTKGWIRELVYDVPTGTWNDGEGNHIFSAEFIASLYVEQTMKAAEAVDR